MKSKRYLCVLLAVSIAASAIGCSDDDDSTSNRKNKKKSSSVETTVTTTTTVQDQTTAAVQTTITTSKPEPVFTPDYDLNGLSAVNAFDFNEGKGWIVKKGNLIALTNKGEELFTLSSSGIVYVSPFKDDCAFVVHKRNDNTTYEEIYNSNGRMLYSTADFDTSGGITEEHIVTQGDGEFLVLRHESGLRANTWLAGTISSSGTVIHDFKAYNGLDDNWGGTTELNKYALPKFLKNYSLNSEMEYDSENMYLGDGIYFLGGESIALRPEDGTGFYVLSGHGNPMGMADNSRVMFQHTGTGDYTVYDFNKKEMKSIGSLNRDNSLEQVSIRLDRGYAEGIIFAGHNFHDITGKELTDLPDFKDLHMTCSRFINDSCLAAIKGADKSEYVTVLDKNGKQRFEPFIVSNVTDKLYGDYFAACDENHFWKLYDINGNTIKDLCTGINCYISDGIVRVYTAESKTSLWKLFTIPVTDGISSDKSNDKAENNNNSKNNTEFEIEDLEYEYNKVIGKNLDDAVLAFDKGFGSKLGKLYDKAKYWISEDTSVKPSLEFTEAGPINVFGTEFSLVSFTYIPNNNDKYKGNVVSVVLAMANSENNKAGVTKVSKNEAKEAFESMYARLSKTYGEPIDLSGDPPANGSEYCCKQWKNTDIGTIDLFWGDNLWGQTGYNNCYLSVSE